MIEVEQYDEYVKKKSTVMKNCNILTRIRHDFFIGVSVSSTYPWGDNWCS